MPEAVYHASFQEVVEVAALLGRVSRLLVPSSGVMHVYLMMRNVQVTGQNDRLTTLERLQVAHEVAIPLLDPVINALEPLTRIRDVNTDQIKLIILSCQNPTFGVMLGYLNVIQYLYWLNPAHNGHTRVAKPALGAVPVLLVPVRDDLVERL